MDPGKKGIGEGVNDSNKDEIELAKLSIEKQKLEIELQKLSIEKSKLVWSSLIGTIPLLAVVFTIFYGIWTLREQEKTQFQLKAAEIMFNAKDPYEIRSRAMLLHLIFPDKLPADLSQKFYPDSLGFYDRYAIEGKLELLRMLSAKTRDDQGIIRNWKKLFPDDRWIDTLLAK